MEACPSAPGQFVALSVSPPNTGAEIVDAPVAAVLTKQPNMIPARLSWTNADE
jgi:hypothetical protein